VERRLGFSAFVLAALLGCAAENAASSDGDLPGSSNGSGGAPNFGSGGTPGVILPASGGLPPEMEEVGAFRPPIVTGRYLWSANPESGRVALIDAATLATRVVSAGLGPTHLAAIPSDAEAPAAIVINTGNSTATVLRATETAIETTELPLHAGADSWAVSPSGDFAVAFSRGEGNLDPTQGLQDLTLIDLRSDEPVSQRLTAGYRPRQVSFDLAESTLIVVSQQGISTFELDGDGQFFLPLSGEDLDVSVTEDGLHALVHAAGSNELDVVTLEEGGQKVSLELAAEVTDLDLAPTGRAVAVVREFSEIAVFDVDALLEHAPVRYKKVTGELIGSVTLSPDGQRAVLFTTTGESDRLTIVETDDPELPLRTVSTETPIASVRTSPDGQHAVALGAPSPGASTGSFTIVALADERFPRIVGTKAPLVDAILDDTCGVVTTSDA